MVIGGMNINSDQKPLSNRARKHDYIQCKRGSDLSSSSPNPSALPMSFSERRGPIPNFQLPVSDILLSGFRFRVSGLTTQRRLRRLSLRGNADHTCRGHVRTGAAQGRCAKCEQFRVHKTSWRFTFPVLECSVIDFATVFLAFLRPESLNIKRVFCIYCVRDSC